MQTNAFLRLGFALLSGLVFGLGLMLSGMTDPAKVLGFLDLAGTWDPSLALVMGGAIAVTAPAFAWLRRRQLSGAHPCNGPRAPRSTAGWYGAASPSAPAGAWRASAQARDW